MAIRFLMPAVIGLVLVAPVPDANAGTHYFFGFNAYGPVAPYYPAYPYYPPYSYYYAPPPVVYAPPPVAYAPPPISQAPARLGSEVGQGCREYTANVAVGGQIVQSYGTACPRADGTWQIIN